MDQFFTRFAGVIASVTGQPLAFVVAFALVFLWAATGPVFAYSDTWQLVINTATTIVTFLMVFLIQNSQNRDAAAMQAKLDELLRSVDTARGAFIGIEHLTDQQIEEIRAALEKEEGSRRNGRKDPEESVERLLERY